MQSRRAPPPPQVSRIMKDTIIFLYSFAIGLILELSYILSQIIIFLILFGMIIFIYTKTMSLLHKKFGLSRDQSGLIVWLGYPAIIMTLIDYIGN